MLASEDALQQRLRPAIAQHPYPLLFATVSGAHLYGFPSLDSDYDLRGVHVLPLPKVVGLHPYQDTIERSEKQYDSGQQPEFELDLVTHDIKKFFNLLLKRNGYVLEQVLSPLVVRSTPEFEELKAIVPGCITHFHSKHYLGFAHTQWKLLTRDRPMRVKPLLYVYRVLLTGIHLMRTGEVEANLATLNRQFQLPSIDDLIQQKSQQAEAATLADCDLSHHQRRFETLCEQLEQTAADSHLPATPSAQNALNDLLIRVRCSYS